MELLKTIALLCQLHNADITEFNYKKQRECQRELAKCVIDSAALSERKSLLECMAKRQY